MSDFLRSTAGRYVAIATAAGTLDFGLAFLLLHSGFSPAISLAVSIAVAGVAQYMALERWMYAGRHGGFSLRRFAGSAVAEAGTYAVRVAALTLWHDAFPVFDAKDHFVGLAVAYAIAFFFGYLIRSRFVFKK